LRKTLPSAERIALDHRSETDTLLAFDPVERLR
jgi:hypothetical protein